MIILVTSQLKFLVEEVNKKLILRYDASNE